MTIRLRTGLFAALLSTGCYHAEYDDAPSPDPDPDHPGSSLTLERPCIRAFAAGELAPAEPDEIFLTYVCDGGAVIEDVRVENGSVVAANAHADFQDSAIRVIQGDLDGKWPDDVINVNEHSPGGWAFTRAAWGGQGGSRLDFERPTTDIAIRRIANASELYLAGDRAIRRVEMSASFPFLGPELELLSGKPFRNIALAQLGGDDQPDLFYVAGLVGQPAELGIATKTATGYTLGTVTPQPMTTDVPLVVADVDGDGIADVIGTAPTIFVQSSRYDRLVVTSEKAAAIAAGDVDGDGLGELVFVTADKTAVKTGHLDSLGGQPMLKTAPLITDGGDAIGVAQLDGDERADVVLAKDVGRPTSSLVIHLATDY